MEKMMEQTLTAQDRCDGCSAAAQVQVALPSGGVLQFCGHHYRKHEHALARQGAETTVNLMKQAELAAV